MATYTILSPGDEIIESVIPHYSETLDLMAGILGANGSPANILDLGAGPGRISEVLHHCFPTAKLTLLDQFEEVLEVARKRLATVEASFISASLQAPQQIFRSINCSVTEDDGNPQTQSWRRSCSDRGDSRAEAD